MPVEFNVPCLGLALWVRYSGCDSGFEDLGLLVYDVKLGF